MNQYEIKEFTNNMMDTVQKQYVDLINVILLNLTNLSSSIKGDLLKMEEDMVKIKGMSGLLNEIKEDKPLGIIFSPDEVKQNEHKN